MTPADLSTERLGAISPHLTLSLLAGLAGMRREHLSAMASGARKIGAHAEARLLAALTAAAEMEAKGTLPERARQGRPR